MGSAILTTALLILLFAPGVLLSAVAQHAPPPFAVLEPPDVPGEQELRDRLAYWQGAAFRCQVPLPGGGTLAFASGQMNNLADPRNPCNDNDELLFNGLLCAGGEPSGCLSVKESMDHATGQLYRNPQYRISKIEDPGGGGAFSPDMALGAQLYALATGDHALFFRWLQWLDGINRCGTKILGRCLDVTLPLFCPGNNNCVIRPGDTATLSRTIEALEAKYGMPGLDHLPEGRLRGYIGTYKNLGEKLNVFGADMSRCGYSQHIGYATTLIHRLTGSNLLDDSARKISNYGCNSTEAPDGARVGNAFYDLLGGHSRQQIVTDILYACPSEATDKKTLPTTWHWENEIRDPSYGRPNLWGCIFAAASVGITSQPAPAPKP